MRTIRLLIVMAGFLILASATNVPAQDWSQWRGAHRDGKVSGFDPPRLWPAELKPQWKVVVGLGDASPVMSGGKIYTFTRQGENEVILCLESATGKELWHYQYPALAIAGPASSQHPGPRSTPIINEGKIVTFGVGGVVTCLDAANGKLQWENKDFTKELPPFFTSMSPMIFDNLCIVHFGGKEQGELVAFDLKTGRQIWQCPGDAPSYASPALMNVAGKSQIVDLTAKNLMGVDPESGKLLWQFPIPTENRFYNAATPVIDGANVIIRGKEREPGPFQFKSQGISMWLRSFGKIESLGLSGIPRY